MSDELRETVAVALATCAAFFLCVRAFTWALRMLAWALAALAVMVHLA